MPFPDMPVLGWGQTLYSEEMGLKSLTHHTGEVRTTPRGEIEIAFAINDPSLIAKPLFFGKVKKPGMKDEHLQDRLVHRVEDGKVIFNLRLPKKGEYSLSLWGYSSKAKGKSRNFFNYMVVSEQNEFLEPFPPGFDDGLGKKSSCERLELSALSHPSGLVHTDHSKVEMSFTKSPTVGVSATLIGHQIVLSDSHRLVTEAEQGDVVTFTAHLPRPGIYGVKVIGKAESWPAYESVYDYVIDYSLVGVAGARMQPDGQEILLPLRGMGRQSHHPPTPSSQGEGQSMRRKGERERERERERELDK